MKIYRLSQTEFRSWREHSARMELMKKIFAEHGVAQVRSPNGRVLGTARQTGERIPIERAKFRQAHHAVRPGECMCREWQKPVGKEEEHHPICANKAAWESQQLHDPDAPRDRVVVSATAVHEDEDEAEPERADSTAPTEPPPPPAATAFAAPPPAASITPGPESCVCHVWAGGNSEQHHPLCQFRSSWERERGVSVLELVELETGEVAREATAEEAAREQAEGTRGRGWRHPAQRRQALLREGRMSAIVKIQLDHILPNPKQVRKTFRRIDELARSIAQYGLLHNLVVVPHTEPGYYEIVAGERRYRALTQLSKAGQLPSTEVCCLVISGEGTFENVVENLVREEVPLWEVGRTYLGFYDSGYTQAQIAAKIGKSQGHVSTAMILARHLAPAVVVRLAQLPPNTVPVQRLLRLSTLVDDEGDANEEAQIQLFQQMLAAPIRRGRRAARPRSQKEAVWQRFQRLRQGKVGSRIDPVYQSFLDSLVKYLAGETKGLVP